MKSEPLSEEQRTIASLPVDSRSLISAGPGTGKTHVLVHRICALIHKGHLNASEILVVSFSRAAVRVIETRLREVEGDARYVRVKTIDSLASRILAGVQEYEPTENIKPPVGWERSGFDDRIRAAADVIAQDREGYRLVSDYRHVIVDEVQDVVGVRGTFLKNLLSFGKGGFTLLGDRAQGIYDFTLEAGKRLEDATFFYRWLSSHYSDSLQTFTLTKNFRTSSPDPILSQAGFELAKPDGDVFATKLSLTQIADRLPKVPSLEALRGIILSNDTASHAILCRTNNEVLYFSRELRRIGIPHQVQLGSGETWWSPWLARVMRAMPETKLRRNTFLAAFPAEAASAWLPADEAWHELRRLCGFRARDLDLNEVAAAIRLGWTVSPLSTPDPSRILLSTVHKAKGLEFDRVYLFHQPWASKGPLDVEASAISRTLYVALTRARQKTYRLKLPELPFMEYQGNRWRVREWGTPTLQIEICSSDSIDDLAPPHSDYESAESIQGYLIHNVRTGDALCLRGIPSSDNAFHTDYEVFHQSRKIGLVSGKGIGEGLQSNDSNFTLPRDICDLYVNGIETVAGMPRTAARYGLGPIDVWIRVRLAGLGTLDKHKIGVSHDITR